MKGTILGEETRKLILNSPKNEITEHIIYEKLSQSTKNPQNKICQADYGFIHHKARWHPEQDIVANQSSSSDIANF